MLKLVLKTSKPSQSVYYLGQGEMVEKLYAIEVKDEMIKRLYEESLNKDNHMTLNVIGLLEE